MIAGQPRTAIASGQMTIESELKAFYQEKGFGESLGKRPLFVGVFTGCLLVPMPNIETRRKYLKYHDLHHLMTGFSVGRIGEGEMSAWELGTGSMWRHPLLGVMNLVALSTGWILKRDRIWAAFQRGRRSRNLYSKETRTLVDADHWHSVKALKVDVVDVDASATKGQVAFFAYVGISLFMHLVVATPAVLCRYFSDARRHGPLAAMTPMIRKDLF
jgi:hypothetical protein